MINMNGNSKKESEKESEEFVITSPQAPVKPEEMKSECLPEAGCGIQSQAHGPEETKKEAYGFKIGQKVLQMTVSATELTRIEPDDDETGLALVEVKYRLRWEGITGQGMEKDVTISFTQEAPEGSEEVLLQQEMMALMLEAKRRFVS